MPRPAGYRTRGHDAAAAHLARSLAIRPPHALLVTAPAGTGGATLATDAARALLCARGDGTLCTTCRPCRLAASGNHADLAVIELPTVDAIRALSASLALAPVEGGRRIALIAHAERMGEPAQQALLKLLEEPPAATHLVLATSDERALLSTIRSRCALVRLGLPERDAAETLLVERLALTPAAAVELLAFAGGRPGPLIAAGATDETAARARALYTALAATGDRAPASRLLDAKALMSQADALLPALEQGSEGGGVARRRAALDLLLRVAMGIARERAYAERSSSWRDCLAGLGASRRALAANVSPELLLDATLLRWPTS